MSVVALYRLRSTSTCGACASIFLTVGFLRCCAARFSARHICVSETSSINALADRVAALTGAEIAHVENPREEPESNEFAVDRKKLANMGLKAHTFDDMLGAEVEALTEILSGRRQRTLPSQLKLA